MSTKKEERQRLHATIWKIASDLKESVDGWDFKQYVLGMLFLPLYKGILYPSQSTIHQCPKVARERGPARFKQKRTKWCFENK